MQNIVISKQLKKARELLHLTIEEVAQKLQINSQEINNWEEGKSRPNLKHLEILSRIYGREIDYFFKKLRNFLLILNFVESEEPRLIIYPANQE